MSEVSKDDLLRIHEKLDVMVKELAAMSKEVALMRQLRDLEGAPGKAPQCLLHHEDIKCIRRDLDDVMERESNRAAVLRWATFAGGAAATVITALIAALRWAWEVVIR